MTTVARRRGVAMRRSLAAALVSLMVVPSAAFAGTASLSADGIFRYIATGGGANRVSLTSPSPNTVVVRDASEAVTAGENCVVDPASPNEARCTRPTGNVVSLVVSAGGGNDEVRNETGISSSLNGEDGSDTLIGGSASDRLRAGQGVDFLDGRDGNDTFETAGNETDTVVCGPGSDTVLADPSDTISADCESGQEQAPGQAQPAPLSAGVGTPNPGVTPPPNSTGSRAPAGGACLSTETGTPGKTPLPGTPANDRLTGTPGGDNIFGLLGNDAINGVQGDDCLFGGGGDDRVTGAEGNDLVRGNEGRDILSGGTGNDRLLGDDDIDKLNGGSGTDALSGGAGRDRLSGGTGNDRLSGGSGNDAIAGGPGRNRYSGGAGRDVINSANGRREIVSCGSGRDTVRADRVDRLRGCERILRLIRRGG